MIAGFRKNIFVKLRTSRSSALTNLIWNDLFLVQFSIIRRVSNCVISLILFLSVWCDVTRNIRSYFDCESLFSCKNVRRPNLFSSMNSPSHYVTSSLIILNFNIHKTLMFGCLIVLTSCFNNSRWKSCLMQGF